MCFRYALFTVGLAIPLCRFASPVLAQEQPASPPSISLSLKPTSSHLSLRLRADGGSAQTYACDGPCVLAVPPGRYQLGVVDGQRATDWHEVDLSQSETIEVHRSHQGLVITGAALCAAGGALVAVGASAFIYGAVSNLETMECDTACGGVSTHFLKVSLAGAGAGVALAAIGMVVLYNAAGPTLTEKPDAPHTPTASRVGALSFSLVPDLRAPRVPIALMNLTF